MIIHNIALMRICLFILCAVISLQANSQIPKREFRGVWIATVANIDWPSKPGLTSEEQQKEFVEILEMHKANGMNAVLVQIRPSADAFYNSPYEPWSKWLTGTLGKYPFPYYDPLEFMIHEAHTRGLEFHAWFNPYRAAAGITEAGPDSASIVRKNPEWFVTYGKNMYFDPGLPEARKHTVNVIMDVVNRYDIDGVHFDDYFYPYRIAKEEFPDSASFEKYKGEFTNREDWRRNNVDLLIKNLHDSIKQIKPFVQFGVSPFGVWRNKSVDPAGSDTRAGQTCYDDLYADVLKWMREGWIDYILPQLYWSIGHKAAPYDVLVKWWNENNFNKPVIIGHGVYKINTDNDVLWKEPGQIEKQIRLNRQLDNIKGSAFFSSKSFRSNPLGVSDSLKIKLYKYKALMPEIVLPPSVKDRQYPIAFTAREKGIQLFWQENEAPTDLSSHSCYVIYRFSKSEKVDLNDARKILVVLPFTENYFTDTGAKRRKKYTYVVTSLDRYNRESSPKEAYGVKASRKYWKLFPAMDIK
jgi:uncharacterized lipoprotein YddW (UPF0748 family)